MALTKSRSKLRIDPEAVYVAWQGAATDVYVVAAGDRLRGDHPAVQALGALAFVPDGTPQNEWPTALDGVIDAAEAAPTPPPARNARGITAATTVSELMVCKTEVVSSTAGSVEAGTILLKSDPKVKAAPAAFEPLGTRWFE